MSDKPRYTRDIHTHAQALKEIAYEHAADELVERVAERLLEISRDIEAHTLAESVPDRGLVADIVNLLTDQGIRFCVIGGLAINVRGQPRGTADVDILVDRMPDERLADPDYARRFNFYRSRSSTGTVQTIDHRKDGQAELLVADSALRRATIETATEASILGTIVPVASAEALVALKANAIANSPSRRAKDGADIVSVVLRNELDLAPWFKYLTTEEIRIINALLPEE